MITLSNGLKLTEADVNAIWEEIAKRITPSKSETLTMEEAAVELGVRCSTKESLSAAFSKFGNRKKYSEPLKGVRAGKTTTYNRKDVEDFRRSLLELKKKNRR